MTATFQAWAGSLTAGEREAIAAYKLDAYEPINEALRLGYDPGEEDQQIIANLDRALARFRLPEPVIVFRGFVDEAVREARSAANSSTSRTSRPRCSKPSPRTSSSASRRTSGCWRRSFSSAARGSARRSFKSSAASPPNRSNWR
jgi:hypothetical protein